MPRGACGTRVGPAGRAGREGSLGTHAARGLIALLGLLLLAGGAAEGAGEKTGEGLVSEQPAVATLPAPGPHWVWVPDRLLGHSLLFDGDSGAVLGMIDTPSELMFPPPLLSRSRGEIYSADIVYARGTRGARSDFVSIYDSETLQPIGEIDVPTRLGQSNASYGYAELLGERFVALYNQFPEVSVTIVDLEARTFVAEIPIAGCAGIYPVADDRFATLCGDGSAMLVVLDAAGRLDRRVASPRFFDPVVDPVAMPAGRDGARWTFVSFAGQVHTVDFSAAVPAVEPPWSLLGADAGPSDWRPGGLQHVDVLPSARRLYVVMHQGGAGSHKEPGREIWVFDLDEQERVARFEPPNMTAAFLAGLAGVEPGTWSYRAMEWLLPSDGVHSIVISRDDRPVLFARNAERGAVAVMDAMTGETLRVLTDAGLAGPTLRVP